MLTLFFITYNEYMSKRSYKEKIMLNDDQVIDLSELFKILALLAVCVDNGSGHK